jgi:hypothetical protein
MSLELKAHKPTKGLFYEEIHPESKRARND